MDLELEFIYGKIYLVLLCSSSEVKMVEVMKSKWNEILFRLLVDIYIRGIILCPCVDVFFFSFSPQPSDSDDWDLTADDGLQICVMD